MRKFVVSLLRIIGIVFLALVCELILTHTNKNYQSFKKVKTWKRRVQEYKKIKLKEDTLILENRIEIDD